MSEELNITGWTCPLPLKNYPTIVMGHGSGGQMMSDLIKHMFLPNFNSTILSQMGDSAVFELPQEQDENTRLAFSTDSFVVSPLIFPGGDIGELAVNGTVNDIAMSGAKPMFLSAGYILEEGLPMEVLGHISTSLANACREAGVELVTGDTKVVNKGHGDGLFINTSGIGIVPAGMNIAPDQAKPGDVIIVNVTMGDLGWAIRSVREGLEFETQIKSDTAPLNGLVEDILGVTKDIHCMRDATRGGLAAALNELADSSKVGIEFEEDLVPVQFDVQSACEMLGLDPLYTANEGKMVAILPESEAEAVLSVPLGKHAAQIGKVVAGHPGLVVAKTRIGGSRVVDLPVGELLPRIC